MPGVVAGSTTSTTTTTTPAVAPRTRRPRRSCRRSTAGSSSTTARWPRPPMVDDVATGRLARSRRSEYGAPLRRREPRVRDSYRPRRLANQLSRPMTAARPGRHSAFRSRDGSTTSRSRAGRCMQLRSTTATSASGRARPATSRGPKTRSWSRSAPGPTRRSNSCSPTAQAG